MIQIHGGDKNVLRAKAERLRGKFDDMRIKEGDTIAQYYGQIKEVVNAIRDARGDIIEKTTIRKVN